MLKNLKIIQLQGLAPSVFCGMYFADQGAEVILITRPQPAPFSMQISRNIMNRNKKAITLSLKNKQDKQHLLELIQQSDVLIDPYRPGVLQKQNLGPKELASINPRIILLRVTGYGQDTSMSLKPGHDLNYISSSGMLKLLNRNPKISNQSSAMLNFPANYVADFVSASLGITGSLSALKERQTTGKGSIVDCSLAGGCNYLTSLVSKLYQQTHSEDLSQSTHNQNSNQSLGQPENIQYYQHSNGKRFLVVGQKPKDHGETTITPQIQKQIYAMQQKGHQYRKLKGGSEICEIVQLQGISQEKLANPFVELQSKQSDDQAIKNLIPSRDSNREEILSKIAKSPKPKL